jgi:hypothetical protein
MVSMVFAVILALTEAKKEIYKKPGSLPVARVV